MKQSPLRPLHESQGARLRPLADEPHLGGDIITYGDVPAEYTAGASAGALLLDVTTRGLVTVTGADATDFLHRILANDIKSLEVGSGNVNLLLTGKGKVVHVFDLASFGEGYLLSTPPGQASALVQALDMYMFTEDVRLSDETEAHAPLELVGPGAGALLERVLPALGPVTDEERERQTFQLVPFHWSDGDEAAMTKVTPLSVAGRAGWRLETEPERVED
ncbi:MAG: hypothetical protein AAGG01_14660, partial [Planctomycetota bacterium]